MMTSIKTEARENLAKRFVDAFVLSEENSFKSYFSRELWSPDQGAALVAGLDPETYRNGQALELDPKEYAKRSTHATAVLNRFLKDQEKGLWKKKDFKITENEIYISAWKFIKWISEKDIVMHKLFFNQLSLTQMELYFEFDPVETALRVASKHSREYHKAYYLKHAEELIQELRKSLSPTAIYEHPHMQNIQRYIPHPD
jgi:hypothetical protein